MATRQRNLVAIRRVVVEGTRSPLFLFMVEHHADLVGENREGRMPWVKLCKRFAKDGLVDGHGDPPTPKRAGKTWRKACDEVQRRAARSRVPAHRSRPAGSYTPALAETAPPSRPVAVTRVQGRPAERPSALTGVATPSRPTAAQDPSVEEQFAEVRRQLAANDRKRFGSM